MPNPANIVTESSERPANRGSGECFYCQRAVGSEHAARCVGGARNVRVRVRVEYEIEIEVPRSWGAAQIERHRTEGSWCANNVVAELAGISLESCLCGRAECSTEYLGECLPPGGIAGTDQAG